MTGNIGRICKKAVAALVLCLAVISVIPAMADANPATKLTIKLPKLKSAKKLSGVKFSAYRIGDVDISGNPHVYSEYKIKKYPQTAAESKKAVKEIEPLLKDKKAVMTAKTNKKGKAVMKDIEEGVYLIKATKTSKYGEVTDFIASLPYYDTDINGKRTGPHYSVTVEPKAGKKKKGSAHSASRGGGSGSPQGGGAGQTGMTTTGNGANPSKTGDETPVPKYMFILMTAGIIALAAAGAIRRRKTAGTG